MLNLGASTETLVHLMSMEESTQCLGVRILEILFDRHASAATLERVLYVVFTMVNREEAIEDFFSLMQQLGAQRFLDAERSSPTMLRLAGIAVAGDAATATATAAYEPTVERIEEKNVDALLLARIVELLHHDNDGVKTAALCFLGEVLPLLDPAMTAMSGLIPRLVTLMHEPTTGDTATRRHAMSLLGGFLITDEELQHPCFAAIQQFIRERFVDTCEHVTHPPFHSLYDTARARTVAANPSSSSASDPSDVPPPPETLPFCSKCSEAATEFVAGKLLASCSGSEFGMLAAGVYIFYIWFPTKCLNLPAGGAQTGKKKKRRGKGKNAAAAAAANAPFAAANAASDMRHYLPHVYPVQAARTDMVECVATAFADIESSLISEVDDVGANLLKLLKTLLQLHGASGAAVPTPVTLRPMVSCTLSNCVCAHTDVLSIL
jgi:hypothetical protein